MEKDLFNKLENKGREIFNNWCNMNPKCKINKFSKNKFSKWDVSYWVDNKPIIGEIKTRNYNHNTFNTWILQYDKYQELINLSEIFKTETQYINIFDDNKMLIWDLKNINTQIKEEQYNKTYAGNNNEILKKVIHLPITTSIIINL